MVISGSTLFIKRFSISDLPLSSYHQNLNTIQRLTFQMNAVLIYKHQNNNYSAIKLILLKNQNQNQTCNQ